MTVDNQLAPALRLALAWQPAGTRGALAALFALEARLGEALQRTNEPMLAQIRLAWWRERLAEIGPAEPPPEPLLEALANTWGASARQLIALVDGWESRIEPGVAVDRFAAGRAGALAAFAGLAGAPDYADAAREVGNRWASAEAGAGQAVSPKPLTLPRRLRGLAVLGGIATRALARGEPMLAGRGAVLAAWRLGLLGR